MKRQFAARTTESVWVLTALQRSKPPVRMTRFSSAKENARSLLRNRPRHLPSPNFRRCYSRPGRRTLRCSLGVLHVRVDVPPSFPWFVGKKPPPPESGREDHAVLRKRNRHHQGTACFRSVLRI